MDITRVKVADLLPDPANARLHSTKNLDAIKASLKKFDQVEALVVRKADNVVIGGNGRLVAMKELGITETDVHYVDIDNTTAKALAIALNSTAETASWDMDILGDTLQGLREDEWDLSDIGFEVDDIPEFMPDSGDSFPSAMDETPEDDDDEDDNELDALPDKIAARCKAGEIWKIGKHTLHVGDNMPALKSIEDNTLESLVVDPPAGISFMGKDWDKDKGGRDEWISWLKDTMVEVKRALKPGAHGLVWALPRTSHWTATAIEDAGFEIRDVVTHLFGSGFPKSLDISKAIDKAAGVEREVVGKSKRHGGGKNFTSYGETLENNPKPDITKPATDAAKKWDGYGTALKPSSEHWLLIRKPISEKSIADNVLKWGVGGINIDGCRVGYQNESDKDAAKPQGDMRGVKIYNSGNSLNHAKTENTGYVQPKGRFPANTVLSGDAPSMLDEQSGECKTGDVKPYKNSKTSWKNSSEWITSTHKGDTGGASRYFYCAKPSRAERNAGIEDLKTWQKQDLNQLDLTDDVNQLQKVTLDDGIKSINGSEWSTLLSGSKLTDESQGYQIHHKNGDGIDNRIENLQLATPIEHKRLHSGCYKTHIGEWIKPCKKCGTYKPIETEYYQRKDGISPWCRGCSIKNATKNKRLRKARQHHPTLKPIKLMKYFSKMVTPPNATILDCFAGSGTTMIAAESLGLSSIGMELEPEHADIILARLEHATQEKAELTNGLSES